MTRYKIIFPIALLLLVVPILGFAQPPLIQSDQNYEEAKADLVSQGWRPIQNLKIHDSSLFAQDVYSLGFLEVVDCISMERDSCLFLLRKNKQVLQVKTFGKDLKVDSYQLIKNNKK